MPWRNCCSEVAATAQTAPRLPWHVATLILVLAGVAGFTAILGAVRRRIVIVGVAAVITAIVGLVLAGTTLAATPQAKVSAQFRHATIHRLSVAADVPASQITTECLRRRIGVWDCSAAVFDQFHLIAAVVAFRFTSVKGRGSYSGPKGPRWVTTLPGIVKGRHLLGHMTGWVVGQPIVGPS